MPISTNIKDYDPASLHFYYESDVFESIRHPEDGEQLIGEAFFIVAEGPSGVRWRRDIGAMGHTVEEDEEGYPIVIPTADIHTLRSTARNMADRLNEIDSPNLNRVVWHYAGACYGSKAYQALGIEEQMASEERVDMGY